MPNHLTFEMKPVKDLLSSLNVESKKSNYGLTIDPFANRKHSYADITNDINPKNNTHFNLCASDFLDKFRDKTVSCVLFDPPYSLRQLKECYDDIGASLTQKHTQTFFSDIKDKIANIIEPGGLVISFGWSSVGMGKNRGFIKEKIILLTHGGMHNDTIITVERRQENG